MAHKTKDELIEYVEVHDKWVFVERGPIRITAIKLHNIGYGLFFGISLGLIASTASDLADPTVLATHLTVLLVGLVAIGIDVSFKDESSLAEVLDVRLHHNSWGIALIEIWKKPGYFLIPLLASYVAAIFVLF